MDWLTAYEDARETGSNTLLFVGNIGDGFPRGDRAFPTDPADLLDPWALALLQRVRREALAWIYDPARGFTFCKPTDEALFRDLLFRSDPKPNGAPTTRDQNGRFQAQTTGEALNGPLALNHGEETSEGDAFAQVRLELARSTPLPSSDTAAAFRAMQTVFEQAAAANGARRPCIAILPDVDAYLCSERGVGSRAGNTLALQVIRFATTDAYYRVGHEILMSAPVAHGLDERLRRPDAPVKLIQVGKPDGAARRTFVLRVMDQEGRLQKERDGVREELAQTKRAVQQESAALLRQARQDLLRLRATREDKRLDAYLATQGQEYRKECHRFRREQKRLFARYLNAEKRGMTPNEWRRLREGQHVVFVEDKGWRTKKALKSIGRGWFVLSRVTNKSESDQWFRHSGFYDSVHHSWHYAWIGGRLVRRRSKKAQKNPFPISKRIRSVIRATESEVIAYDRLVEVGKELTRIEKEATAAFAKKLKEQETQVRELEAAARKPTDKKIKALQKKLRALDQSVDRRAAPDTIPLLKGRVPEFVDLTVGYGYRDLVGLLRTMRARGKSASREELVALRQEIITRAYGEYLEIVEPAFGFNDLAGLGEVKQFFREVRDAVSCGDLRRVPMGAMLVGPPGTGKTASAEAFARECGFLFVKLKNVRNMFVGESERIQELVLQALRDLAPVVVLRDEVDEEDSGRDTFQGDSNVSAHLRRAWMEFLSDPKIRGRVFVVSCSNRPDRLDAALKRSGRTDERIPVLMPDLATREEIFRVMVRRGEFPCTVKRFRPFAEMTDGLSGADLEVIVRRAYQFARQARRKAIDDRALREATLDFIPSSSAAEIARMTILAIREASSKRYLPRNTKEIVRKAEETLRLAA